MKNVCITFCALFPIQKAQIFLCCFIHFPCQFLRAKFWSFWQSTSQQLVVFSMSKYCSFGSNFSSWFYHFSIQFDLNLFNYWHLATTAFHANWKWIFHYCFANGNLFPSWIFCFKMPCIFSFSFWLICSLLCFSAMTILLFHIFVLLCPLIFSQSTTQKVQKQTDENEKIWLKFLNEWGFFMLSSVSHICSLTSKQK